MANRKISYTERDFEGLRQDLINFTRQYYPELIDKAIVIAPLLNPEHEPIFWFSYFAKWRMKRWLLTDDLIVSETDKFEHA